MEVPMMQAGKLRHRIVLQKVTMMRDEEGNAVETWSDFVTVWASVEPIRGREYFEAAAINTENDLRFVIRYRSGITSEMRVWYNDRIFDIQSVIDIDEAHKELELICKEVMNDD
jgi:SPP1 family predicted phage head-tail adaptor